MIPGPTARSSAALVAALLLSSCARGASPAPLQSLDKTKSLAASQHEIVMLLLEKKEYAKAQAEAAKIFQMNWPDSQEDVLLKELRFLADQFLHYGPQLGLDLLESSEKNFKARKSRIAILKEKGYLYKSLNQRDKAIECFREAQRLEQQEK